MRRIVALWLVLGALALAGLLAGCRGGNDEAATAPFATPPATGTETAGGAALTTQQVAGPFQVTLSTEPAEPKAGETRFEAKVTRNGQLVTDATVSPVLSMPTMNMGGPSVTLSRSGDEYEGTANLGMGGEWQAVVTVRAGGETGTATYRFMAGQ